LLQTPFSTLPSGNPALELQRVFALTIQLWTFSLWLIGTTAFVNHVSFDWEQNKYKKHDFLCF
jgi:hypothetical protein